MRKSIIFILMLGLGANLFAQNPKNERPAKTDWTPEQKATIKTKKMALALDLSDAQQTKLQNFNQEWAKKEMTMKEQFRKERSETESLTADQKFDHESKMLDLQLEYQKEMKSLLNAEQYEDWKSMRKRSMYKKGMHRKEMHRKEMHRRSRAHQSAKGEKGGKG